MIPSFVRPLSLPGHLSRLIHIKSLKCPKLNYERPSRRWFASNPADDPSFVSIVDNSPTLVRTGRRHGPGLIILGIRFPLLK